LEMIEEILSSFLKSFITLFVIMDPFGGLPAFISVTKGMSNKERIKNADRAIIVASLLLFAFLFFGVNIFSLFNISISSFMIAGGIILMVIGVLYTLGISLHDKDVKREGDVASVPIGTPLLTGPGVITSTIILVNTYGILIPFFAAAATLLVSWYIYRSSDRIYKFIGHPGANILSRVMGIILTAIAVEFIKGGISVYLV